MLSQRQVGEIGEFFDNYERYVSELKAMSSQHNRHVFALSDNMTSSKSTENLKFDRHNVHRIDNQSHERSASALSALSSLKPPRKSFYLPEEKIHSNDLLKIRQHFDKSCSNNDIVEDVDKHEVDANGILMQQHSSEIGTTKNHTNAAFECCTSLNKYDQKILQSTSSNPSSSSSPWLSSRVIKINEYEAVMAKTPTITTQQPSAVIKYDNEIEFEVLKQQQQHQHYLKAIKSSTVNEMKPQIDEHNSILMNDDYKLHGQQQDLQTSPSSSSVGTCRDKNCKSTDAAVQCCKINEISTDNSRCANNLNLDLDLYFDKELQAWKQKAMDGRDDESSDDATITTSETSKSSCSTIIDDDINNDEEYVISDEVSISSEFTTTTTESDSDASTIIDCAVTSIPCDRQSSSSSMSQQTATMSDANSTSRPNSSISVDNNNSSKFINGRSMLFTDGNYIYGPYNFDIFANIFYQFNDDESDSVINDENDKILHDQCDKSEYDESFCVFQKML